MKLLFVVSTLGTGGAQKVAADLSIGLSKHFEIDFLLNDDEDITYEHIGRILDLGLEKKDDKSGLFYQLRVFVRRLTMIRRLVNENEYSAVISFLDSANYANILSISKGQKKICTVHSVISRYADLKYRFIVAPLNRLLYKRADRIVCVSKGVEDDLKGMMGPGIDNTVTIYNGFDLEKIKTLGHENPDEDDLALLTRGPIISTVGRLCREKGQWHLIRAMKIIVERFPQAKLLIVGEGPYRKYLEKLVNETGLTGQVIMTGFRNNPYSIVGHSDVFVMSSLVEGLPTALIEALALNMPCVSTDFVAGAREILAPDMESGEIAYNDSVYMGKYGLLTKCCDGVEYSSADPLRDEEKMLAEAVLMLLTDKNLAKRYSDASMEAVSVFDIEKVEKKWLDVIGDQGEV